MYALVFILLFYVGSLSQVWHLLGGILLSQWVLIAGSLLLFLRLRGYDLRDSLGLHRPRLRTLGAAFLMGVSAWYPLVALTRVESGTPSPQNEALEKAFEQLLGGEQSLLLILFVIALSPAVCEELLFRGLIMRSMVGRFRTRTVVVVTALLFGALHLYASRFVPTTVLGVLCAFLALRGHSILPAMLFHFLNNGTAVVLARFQWSLPGITEPGPLDTTQAGTAAFLLLTGAWLLWGGRPTESVSTA
jgi:sodium transport system permease protein